MDYAHAAAEGSLRRLPALLDDLQAFLQSLPAPDKIPAISLSLDDAYGDKGVLRSEVRVNQVVVGCLREAQRLARVIEVNLRHINLSLALRTPPIQDGGNFGVGVLKAVAARADRCFVAVDQMDQHLSKYLRSRQEIARSILRTPKVQDLHVLLSVTDSDAIHDCGYYANALHRLACVLLDTYAKNADKVNAPRPATDAQGMY